MTEKQFECEGNEIIRNNEVWAVAYSEHNANVISTALNEIIEENEQLKKDRNEMFIRERDTENKWRELKKENEQLQSRNYRQAKELDKIYHMIEQKKLESII